MKYRRKDSQSRREDLIEAGIRCLSEGGMSNFTVDKICKQANVSRGLINHHFKSKDELLLCIYDSMTSYLTETTQYNNAEQQLSALIESSFDKNTFDRSHLRAWLAIWGEVATHAELRQLHEKRYRQYHHRLRQIIAIVAEKRLLKVDTAAIARQLIALIDGLWLAYCLHSKGYSLHSAARDCYHFLQHHLGQINFQKAGK